MNAESWFGFPRGMNGRISTNSWLLLPGQLHREVERVDRRVGRPAASCSARRRSRPSSLVVAAVVMLRSGARRDVPDELLAVEVVGIGHVVQRELLRLGAEQVLGIAPVLPQPVGHLVLTLAEQLGERLLVRRIIGSFTSSMT